MRKSLLALLLAVALVAPVFAAEKNMWVGGSFGYASVNMDLGDGARTASSTAWSVEPEFGWTIVDKWDIGLDFSYGSGSTTELYGLDFGQVVGYPFKGYFSADAKTTSIAPFARYYLAKVAGVDVILKASFFYAKTDLDFGDNVPPYLKTMSVTGYGISIAPIISYNINESWSIGAKLNFAELTYVHVDLDEDYFKLKTDEFGFNLNNGSLISVGFAYHF